MMKKGFGSGFAAGLLCTALVAGLSMSALAVNRTININDQAQITINGATFVPKDASGAKLPIFTHENTVYVPAKALCDAAGLTASYDAASRTVAITLPAAGIPASSPAASGNYITAERAKEIALNHAGVQAADAHFIQTGLEWDDGRAEYEVEFYAGDTEYDYDIDAVTGEIRSFDHDVEYFSIPGTNSSASITAEEAQKIALNRAPSGASVVKCKLDYDDGRTVYEVDLRNGSAEYECEIDASTGRILSWEEDH
ncbi:MAG: peptidase [Provencibacterium sp.]|nr:peptidase [Provencibacterium sp.]